MANLADMSGKVAVSVRAESEQGFDKSKLQNGVLEPLKEADLIQRDPWDLASCFWLLCCPLPESAEQKPK